MVADELLGADATQSEAQLRRHLGLPPCESAAAIPIPDGPKLSRILTPDDVRAIVREEMTRLADEQRAASAAEPLSRADIPVIVDSIVELVAERLAAANTIHLECGPIKPVTVLAGLQHARFERTT
ncbi:hypothetical protein GS500_04685 [Rhodococcus hoagii]|nr:hypothetical protein [Prescottella equi]